jgi:NAD(P)-dependent dehydrogenase (short-subunit alcohol dehydrogenase family)
MLKNTKNRLLETLMTDKIALVTGANKSIGFEVVRAFAAMGMVVYLGSRDEVAGRRAAQELAEVGDVRFIRLDTTDDATLTSAIATISDAHGRLDILVNNAGIAPGGGGGITCPIETTRMALETNAHGPARLIQLAVPLLRQSAEARVVNVSSMAGSMAALGNPTGALAEAPFKPYAYCLSKIALNGVTVLFADELKKDNIKVNAVCPGLVNSKVSHFMGTRGPAEGAQIIVELATIDDDGPTGGFFNENGSIAW